jgi:hypothetical protein
LDEKGYPPVIVSAEAKMINENVSAFNDKIEGLVKSCRRDGMNIYFVDVEDEFDKDGGHPAYSKNQWIEPITIPVKYQDINHTELASSCSMHPTSRGAQAYADCVNAEIKRINESDGIKGVVVMLTDGGRHGVIMSLDETCLAWCNLPRKQQKKVGAADRYDGMKNMQAVEKYIAENSLSWSNFPAFEWCRAKGEGWYLPSINELWSAGTMFLGGSRTASNRKFRKNFNQALETAGGTPLSGVMIYHSSTEDTDVRYSLYSHMNSEPPYIQPCYKADDLFVRAFHKF